MTKKQQLIETLNASRMGCQDSVRIMFWAIIDALPEEPEKCEEARIDREIEEVRDELRHKDRVGPEPVDVNSLEPGSSLTKLRDYAASVDGAIPAEWLIEQLDAILSMLPTPESVEWGKIYAAEEAMTRPTSAFNQWVITGRYGNFLSQHDTQQEAFIKLGKEGWTTPGDFKVRHMVEVDLGQRSDPPATSPAQPPPLPEGWDTARKLRIMKAMEEQIAIAPTVKFKYAAGCWWRIDSSAGSEWTPFFQVCAPEQPLWEGDTWVMPDSASNFSEPFDNDPRWRKIKVREVRL